VFVVSGSELKCEHFTCGADAAEGLNPFLEPREPHLRD
jgi:hypothetical protein